MSYVYASHLWWYRYVGVLDLRAEGQEEIEQRIGFVGVEGLVGEDADGQGAPVEAEVVEGAERWQAGSSHGLLASNSTRYLSQDVVIFWFYILRYFVLRWVVAWTLFTSFAKKRRKGMSSKNYDEKSNLFTDMNIVFSVNKHFFCRFIRYEWK